VADVQQFWQAVVVQGKALHVAVCTPLSPVEIQTAMTCALNISSEVYSLYAW